MPSITEQPLEKLTLFQVSGLENEVRGLAAQFERYLMTGTMGHGVLRLGQKGLTFFRLLFAAASIIFLPVTVEPVNATLSTSG
jgi:hypothetical protein